MLLPSGNPIICHKSLCPYSLSSLLINNVLTFSPHDWVDAQKVYREMRTHYCMFIFILSSIVSSACLPGDDIFVFFCLLSLFFSPTVLFPVGLGLVPPIL